MQRKLKAYSVAEQNSKTKLKQASIALVEEIGESTMALPMFQDTALLQSMGIINDILSDSDSCRSEVEELESCSEDNKRSSTDCENEAVNALPKSNHGNTENKDMQVPTLMRFDSDFCSKEVAVADSRLSHKTLLSWLWENKIIWFYHPVDNVNWPP